MTHELPALPSDNSLRASTAVQPASGSIALPAAALNMIVSRLRFRHLRLLVALDDQGSLLQASEQVALTQRGASKALHEIEAMFGSAADSAN